VGAGGRCVGWGGVGSGVAVTSSGSLGRLLAAATPAHQPPPRSPRAPLTTTHLSISKPGQVLAVFGASFISGTLFSQIQQLLENPQQILVILGTGVPQTASFFILCGFGA